MNTKRNSILVGLTLLAVLTAAAGAAVAGPVLVAHPGVDETALSAAQVQQFFLGKTGTWSNGTRVVLATLKDSAVGDEFLKTYVKKSPQQFTTFWKKAVFSGTGEMPAAFATEAELVQFVAGHPGALGFIDEATAHEGLKVIAIQ